jgi:microcin C transport system permease protein
MKRGSMTLRARRWRQFRSNRRGWYALWFFLFIFTLSLGAELIANDKPILVHYQGALYFPVFKSYPETTFGGFFDTEGDYTDPYLQELIEEEGWMLWPPVRYHYRTHKRNLKGAAPTSPDRENWLGTDDQGRDLFARLLYGFRVSVLFGLLLTLLCSVMGVLVGGIQGYFGGKIDLMGQRLIEIWSGLPTLYLLIILASFVEPNFGWLLLLMTAFSWMGLVGVVRAEFLRARNFEYVRAAHALGVRDTAVMYRHILPNAMVATLTFLPFILNGAIVSLTALDFLGFGLPPGSASLGELLNQGKNNLHAWWLPLTSFTVLALSLTALNFIGEAVRDAFDPRKIGF